MSWHKQNGTDKEAQSKWNTKWLARNGTDNVG